MVLENAIFPRLKKNYFKGWKKNLSISQMLTVVHGKVTFFLLDERKKKKYKFILDDNKNYKKLIIPKNIWYSFKNNSKNKSIIFNFIKKEHNKTKVVRAEKLKY